MNRAYDVVLIGGGHNGLTAAAFLAQAGKRVLVLERRSTLGGAAATEEVFPGYQINTGCSSVALLRPEVVRGLFLDRHGLKTIDSPVRAFVPQSDGRALTLWRDPEKSAAELSHFSENDAKRYPAFLRQNKRMAAVLSTLMTLTPPNLPKGSTAKELLPWAKVGLKIKGLGDRDMMEFLRILPMSAADFLNEWFESEPIKGALGVQAVSGSMQGPMASGTALTLLYQSTGSDGPVFVLGGIGKLSEALASVIRQHRGEIQTGANVVGVLIEDEKAVGVALENGDQIHAQTFLSNADPHHTLLQLVGARHLPVKVFRRVKNIRFRGTTSALHLAVRNLPLFTSNPKPSQLSGEIIINPTLTDLERAYDDAKYGRYSQKPVLKLTIPTVLDPSLAPNNHHILSITAQYTPYRLQDSDWEEQKWGVEDSILNTLEEYAPGLRAQILHKLLITPQDWEREYGLPEGSIYHGQMGLDQLLFMRPFGGYARYQTPVENLYLCGAGNHPGGGVTGAPGFNAAREVLKNTQ